MKRIEWDAMGAREKNLRISEVLFGRKPRKPTHGNCCTCQSCGQAHDECICGESSWESCYTENRNTCALVLDEIEKRGETAEKKFLAHLWWWIGGLSKADQRPDYWRDWAFLRADPDTICYAALKAVNDEQR